MSESKPIRWYLIGLATIVVAAGFLGIWKMLSTKATPEWVRRNKQRAAIRKEALTVVQSQSPDMAVKLVPYLRTDAGDIAAWALGRIGPRAAVAAKEIETVRQEKIRRAYKTHYPRFLSPPGRSEVLERILGCARDTPSVTESEFASRFSNKRLKLQGWKGYISSVETPAVEMASDNDAWLKLWVRHGAHPTCRPKIDFEKNVVVGIFLGTTTFTEFADLAEIADGSNEVIVRYHNIFSDAISDSPSSPYLFFQMKRPSVPIKVIRIQSHAMSTHNSEKETLMAQFVPNKK